MELTTRDDTAAAKQLRETGPGVMHVAWGIDGIDQVFNDPQHESLRVQASIEPSSSHGIYFQLAEGEHS